MQECFLLPQLVTSITRDRRVVRLVAVHASLHRSWNIFCDDVTLPNNAVALAAVDGRLVMARMTEENEVLDGVDLVRREGLGIIAQRRQTPNFFAVALHGAMAGHTFRNRRKPRSLFRLDRLVTVHAFNLQRRVLLVTEMHCLLVLRGETRYGKEKATSESE